MNLYMEDYDAAEPLFVEAVAKYRSTLGDDDASTLQATHQLSELYRVQNNLNAAEPLLARYVTTIRRLGIEDPICSCILGQLYVKQQKFDAAEPLLADALTTYRNTRDDDDRDVLVRPDLVTTREISAVDLPHSRRRPFESTSNWIAVRNDPPPDSMRHRVASRGGDKRGTTWDDSCGRAAIPVAISIAESWWVGAIPVAISIAESSSRR